MKKEILFQLDIACQLFEYHFHNLSEEERREITFIGGYINEKYSR